MDVEVAAPLAGEQQRRVLGYARLVELFENRVRTSDAFPSLSRHYARFERNALILVVRGSFISRSYSADSTATKAILPSALLCIPHP